MKQTDSAPKSLTPQRKHRKLLKDGSGSEVWPEAIEKIFVQGLREYWDSPYATYSQSRGRSRWRNQYLVDFLQRSGITRSKKQVASHIQVLRNMWKGEPEFHLVAGGDELSSDTPPVKVEEHWDTNNLIPFDYDDHDPPSSHSASPDFSPPDFLSDFPPTPEHRPNLYPSDVDLFPSAPNCSPAKSQYSPTAFSHLDLTARITAPSASPYEKPLLDLVGRHPPALSIPPSRYFPTALSPHSPPVSQDARKPLVAQTRSPTASSPYARFPLNRVTTFGLTADGMTPFAIRVDALIPPTSPPVVTPLTIRIKLSIPLLNDPRSPPSLHGFAANACLSGVWSMSGKCVTKVYSNQILVNEETGYLDVSHINVGNVNVLLPESTLSRCRWIEPSMQTMITQEIIIDDDVLLYVIYDLDRRTPSSMPSASYIGCQKYRAVEKRYSNRADFQNATSPILTPNPMSF